MIFPKKSLGQNFLIDKNIIKKIVNLTDINNKDVIEIGPGKGELTDQILSNKPKSLQIIEKDSNLFKILKLKYSNNKIIKIYNSDILRFNLEQITNKGSIIFGNLPYNISSQILVKIIKFRNWPPRYSNLVFMFQKELGDKILGKYSSKNYGRLSIITHYRLKLFNKFLVSPNSFFPRPKINSVVLHLVPKYDKNFKIKNIDNLEKVTNILFSNKRKMIKKSIEKILNINNLKKIEEIDLSSRPSNLKPEIYYRITELYEKV